jgi:hypothetical protein
MVSARKEEADESSINRYPVPSIQLPALRFLYYRLGLGSTEHFLTILDL